MNFMRRGNDGQSCGQLKKKYKFSSGFFHAVKSGTIGFTATPLPWGRRKV